MDTQKAEYIEWADWLWYMLSKKLFGLKYHGQKIKNLCVRGSQCDYGINPEVFDDFTYNFGLNNQDLFCTYHVLKNYLSYVPNCKNIILFYCIYLNGFDLLKTHERYRSFYYKKILNVPYDIDASNISDFPTEITCNEDLSDFNGYMYPSFEGQWNVKERTKGHLKNFHRNKHGLVYLRKIYNLCKEHNIKLHIVIPPHRPDYVSYIPKDELEQSIQLLKKIVPSKYIYNFFDDTDFNYKDFSDTDHLNLNGATTLSRKINNILQKQKKYEKIKCLFSGKKNQRYKHEYR